MQALGQPLTDGDPIAIKGAATGRTSFFVAIRAGSKLFHATFPYRALPRRQTIRLQVRIADGRPTLVAGSTQIAAHVKRVR